MIDIYSNCGGATIRLSASFLGPSWLSLLPIYALLLLLLLLLVLLLLLFFHSQSDLISIYIDNEQVISNDQRSCRFLHLSYIDITLLIILGLTVLRSIPSAIITAGMTSTFLYLYYYNYEHSSPARKVGSNLQLRQRALV